MPSSFVLPVLGSPGLAERECIGSKPRREVELEDVGFELRITEQRVQAADPLDAKAALPVAVDEDVEPAATPEDQEDVLREEVKA
jgi:hypothetical protein